MLLSHNIPAHHHTYNRHHNTLEDFLLTVGFLYLSVYQHNKRDSDTGNFKQDGFLLNCKYLISNRPAQ